MSADFRSLDPQRRPAGPSDSTDEPGDSTTTKISHRLLPDRNPNASRTGSLAFSSRLAAGGWSSRQMALFPL